MAQIQIELAWLRYARTLLARGGMPSFGQVRNLFGGDLMRQETVDVEIKSAKGSGARGAIGGAGETQLQVEQYNLRVREAKLSQALKQLQSREQKAKAKKHAGHKAQPLVALVGYTNAGKSALTNLCTGAGLESDNLLFQTLNTATRGLRLPNGQQALLLDTVGFITDLPHGLVESFKATLDEIHHADVLVHVRDISHPHTDHQRQTVLRVLKEIGIGEDTLRERYLEVWNKIDLLPDEQEAHRLLAEAQGARAEPPSPETSASKYQVVPMSCETGENKDLFLEQVGELAVAVTGKKYRTLTYPGEQHYIRRRWLSRHGGVNEEDDFQYDGEAISVRVLLDDVAYQRYLKEFEPELFEASRAQARPFKRQKPSEKREFAKK